MIEAIAVAIWAAIWLAIMFTLHMLGAGLVLSAIFGFAGATAIAIGCAVGLVYLSGGPG
jgi:hypothetical protein